MNTTLPERLTSGLLAGVDEAGRGPLAGDVVAAAVVLEPSRPITGLADSKKLSQRQREARYQAIVDHCRAWAVGRASPAEIDSLNILHATLLAMQRAVQALPLIPDEIWVDGNRVPTWSFPSRAVVKGDSRVAEISAASIVAKVTRDRDMLELDRRYPGYGFLRHKGYPTRAHGEALTRLGASPAHRRSFRPVADVIA